MKYDDSDTRGMMRPEFVTWCGKCADWETQARDTRKRAGKLARLRGWTWTRAHGWRCKRCSEEAAP